MHASSIPSKYLQPKMVLSISVLFRVPNDCVTLRICLCMTLQVISVIHLPRGHVLMIVAQYQTLAIPERC